MLCKHGRLRLITSSHVKSQEHTSNLISGEAEAEGTWYSLASQSNQISGPQVWCETVSKARVGPDRRQNLTPASGLCMHTCAYVCEPTQVNTYRPHPHRNILRARCPWSVFRSICQGTAEIFVTQILRMLLVSDNLKLLRCKCCLKVLMGGQ